VNKAERRNGFLMVKNRVDEIRNRYEARERIDKLRALVYGHCGTGKSRLALSCPQPVFADSFDPQGFELRALRKMKTEGRLIVDDRWERDDWKNPFVYRDWEKEMLKRRKEHFFDYIGTYFLDGTTRWAQSMMYAIMKKGSKNGPSRAGGTPEIQDYLVQQMTGADELGRLLDLPCHVIVTGLIGTDKDEVSGKTTTGLLLSGKFSAQIPPLFSEVYVAQAAKGDWHLMTKPESTYFAKTRMGEGLFLPHEKPDIKALIRKAGMDDSDHEFLEDYLVKGVVA